MRQKRHSPEAAPANQKPAHSAKAYAAWLLGRREWSEKELLQRLALKGYDAQDAQAAVDFLKLHKFQSDERFAESKVRSSQRRLGNRRIAQDLKAKGIATHTVESALEAAASESERALEAAERFQGKEWTPQLQAKAWRYLASRGFSGDAVKSALRAVKESAQLG